MKPLILLVAGGLIVLAVGALALRPGDQVPGPADPENADLVARGQVVYADHCASCHGRNLEGQANWRERKPDGRLPAPPHDDSGHTWHHPDEQLFRLTKFGVKPPLAPDGYESDMPAFAEILSDEDIWAVLSFIKSTWSEKSRAYQDRIDRAYREQAGQD